MGYLNTWVPFDAAEMAAVPLHNRDDVIRCLLRREIQAHQRPSNHAMGICPAAHGVKLAWLEGRIRIYADIAMLAYWNHVDGGEQPLIIESPNMTRKEALVHALHTEATLRAARDWVPYTVAWWYRTPSDGHKSYVLLGLDHIGLDALVNG